MHAHDLTLAFRNLANRRQFAVTAILLMALASGTNGIVVSVVRGVLIKPLPYAQPERLVAFWPGTYVSNEELGYWRDRTRSFQQIAALSPGWMMALVAEGREPLKVTGAQTSGNFFTTLGVSAAIGRTIVNDDAQPGRPRVVVLSAAVFERAFAADAAAIGRRVQLDGDWHEIIGVMPSGFEFMEPGTDVWTPMPFDPTAFNHKTTFSMAVARLAAGATPDAATGELVALAASMRRDLGKPNDWGQTINVVPLLAAMTSGLQNTLLVLLGAAGFILLLAAINLATLFSSQSIQRAPEMAIRAALGASPARLIQQLLVEHGVLSAGGVVAGLLLARGGLPLVVNRLPAEMPRLQEISLDSEVFAVVFAASMCIALLFALLPVALTARPQSQTLRPRTHSTDPKGRQRLLGSLVAAQLALTVVLGIGAGLMLRTLWNLQQTDPGFRPEGVLTFRLQTTSKYEELSNGLVYMEQVVERVRALPGVRSVGSIQHLPMSGYNWTAQVYPVERPPSPGAAPPRATWRFIGWSYFETMGIPLRAGRMFSQFDREGSPGVAIVNETFARREYGSAAAAVGRRLHLRTGRRAQEVEIVGVSGDVRYVSLDTAPTPEIYRPLAQTFMFPMAFVVRTSGDPARLGAGIRRSAYEADPVVPVAEIQPLAALVAQTLARSRLATTLLGVFACAALLLTVIGVYGVVGYWVRQRQREFGIRLALGAPPRRIVRGVLQQGAAFALAGIAIALPAAWLMSRVLHSMVYGITPRDPLTFAVLPAMVLIVTLCAAYWPARRAAAVDPVMTMRGE